VEDRVPLFPLHTLLLPHTDLGLHVFEERYRTLVTRCLETGDGFGVVLIAQGREVGGPARTHAIGTLARIAGYARLPDGRFLLEVEGSTRFRIHRVNGSEPYPEAEVGWLSEPIGNFAEARSSSEQVDDLLRTYRSTAADTDPPVQLPVDPVARSYVAASLLRIDAPEKQKLLEAETAAERLVAEVSILRRELALLEHLRAQQEG
jgi:uncharacterized protein